MLSSSVSLPHHTSLAIDGSYSTCFRSNKVRNIKEKKEHRLAVLLISRPFFFNTLPTTAENFFLKIQFLYNCTASEIHFIKFLLKFLQWLFLIPSYTHPSTFIMLGYTGKVKLI